MLGKEPLLDFGDVLRGVRKTCRFTQAELAGLANVSCRHISFLETSRARPSEAMVSRLASSMKLDTCAADELRVAAGFCPRRQSRSCTEVGGQAVETALAMENAADVAQLVARARCGLRRFGVDSFFLGSLLGDERRASFEWAALGAFPEAWLHQYDRERYAMTDPLLEAVRKGAGAFFWDEVADRRSLRLTARAMFDRLSASGNSSGFVVPWRTRTATHVVSMMGAKVDHTNRAVRIGIELVAGRLLTGLDKLGALPRRQSAQPHILPRR